MALQKYAITFVRLNGFLLVEETEVTVNRDSRSQEVATVAKQYAGESPGAGIMTIDIVEAVPALAFELNFGTHFVNIQDEVEIQMEKPGGESLTTTGFIINDNFRHGVNSPAHINCHIRASLADWVA
jgi:hypothetical protein